MWAIFCHGEDTNLDFAPHPGGGYDVPLDAEVPHPPPAAEATAYAGRLIALEREGHLRIAARSQTSTPPPTARPARRGHAPRGRRADRHHPRGPRRLARDGPALASGPSGAPQPLRPRRPVPLPVLARHRRGPHRRGPRPGGQVRGLEDRRRRQPPQRPRLLGRRRAHRPPGRSPPTAAPTRSRPPRATSPTSNSMPSGSPAASSASPTSWTSCAPTATWTPTRR